MANAHRPGSFARFGVSVAPPSDDRRCGIDLPPSRSLVLPLQAPPFPSAAMEGKPLSPWVSISPEGTISIMSPATENGPGNR